MRRRNERHVAAIEETAASQDGSLRERRDQWVEEKLDPGITRRQRTRQERAEDQKKPSSLCPFPSYSFLFLSAIAFQITHITAFIRRQPSPRIPAPFYNTLDIRDWDSGDATVAQIRELIANPCTLLYLPWNMLCIDLPIGIDSSAGKHTPPHTPAACTQTGKFNKSLILN